MVGFRSVLKGSAAGRLGIRWMSAAGLEPSEEEVRLMVSGAGAERPTWSQ